MGREELLAYRKRSYDEVSCDRAAPSPKRPRTSLNVIALDEDQLSVRSLANDSTDGSIQEERSQSSSPRNKHRNFEPSVTSTASVRRPKTLFCKHDGCDKAFDRPARLEIHMRSHTNERPFQCVEDGCGKTFLRNEHLKAHIKSKHNNVRDYICTYVLGRDESGHDVQCGKSFHTGQRLRRHMAAHEEKEQTKCQECGQVFRKLETLQRHIRSAHLNEHAYRCQVDEECGLTFATVGQLKAHEAREHSGRSYTCAECQDEQNSDHLSFPTYAELQEHLRLVHPPCCQQCGLRCSTRRELKAHMEIIHSTLTSRQRFECEYDGCDRKFTKRGNLKVHMQSVHAKIKAFICGQTDLSTSTKLVDWSGIGCGTRFGSKAALESHVQTQHLGLLQNISEISEGAAMLSQHGQTTVATSITGHDYHVDRPLSCLQKGCISRFRRNHDLAIHLELHHNWQIDDVNDALEEAAGLDVDEAFDSEHFWVGGINEPEGSNRISHLAEGRAKSITHAKSDEPIDEALHAIDPKLCAA